MKREIVELKGLWRGGLFIEGQEHIVDLQVRHPQTSFFTIYTVSGKPHFEWQAKPSLNQREDGTWEIILNDPLTPLENNRYTNLILWSWTEKTIIVQLDDNEKITLSKLVNHL
jgi:hypothetical protein